MDKRWKVICSFVIVFAAGAVVGGVFQDSRIEARYEQWSERARDGARNRGEFADRALHHFTEKLNLTPEQVEQVKPILETAGQKMRQVRSDWSQNTASVAEEMNESVAAILKPDQRAAFAQMIREMKTRMKRIKGMPGKEMRGIRGGPRHRPLPPPE